MCSSCCGLPWGAQCTPNTLIWVKARERVYFGSHGVDQSPALVRRQICLAIGSKLGVCAVQKSSKSENCLLTSFVLVMTSSNPGSPLGSHKLPFITLIAPTSQLKGFRRSAAFGVLGNE